MTPRQDSGDTSAAALGHVGALSGLWRFVRPHGMLILAALAALTVTVAVALSMPLAVRWIVDGLNQPDPSELRRYFAFAAGVCVLLAIGSSLRNFLTRLLGERVVADMRQAIFARMIHMSPAFFDRVLTGDVLSRMTADTTLILLVVGNTMSMALRHVIMFCGGCIMMVLTSVKLTGLTAVIVPVVMAALIAIGRRVRANAKSSQDGIAAASGTASEALGAAAVVQAYTNEDRVIKRFNTVADRALVAARQVILDHAMMNAGVILVVSVGILGVVWIGVQDVGAGLLTLGQLVQFVFYAAIVASSIAAFSDIWGEAQRAAGAVERIQDLLHVEDPVVDPVAPAVVPPGFGKRLAFEAVRFAYPARPGVAALDGVSFSVSPGETVALVGPSGAGKSTVAQLALRFYDPSEGRVCIDDHDLRDLRLSDLRQTVAVVRQDPVIFAASVRDNIRFGNANATSQETEAAARAAFAHDFISTMPEGYDTFLGEKGVMLSGGQKQRLAIARAMLSDAPILLLDEATSALDAESERMVQDALDRLSADKTLLVIAHRLATVRAADRILVFEGGRIVAEGSHDVLMADGGLYADLARLQFLSETSPSGG